jgi:hypothetical protein
MATVDRARSAHPLRNAASRDNLAAPPSRATSKGPESSAVSVASSDTRDDDLHKSSDGALDKMRRRGSDDGRSDTSSPHRRRMSRMFKGRSKHTKSAASQDDLSQREPNEDIPPVPHVRRPSAEPRNYSDDDSLGLHKSVASSLLTEDSDSEP